MINQIILKKYLELPVFDNNYNLKKYNFLQKMG